MINNEKITREWENVGLHSVPFLKDNYDKMSSTFLAFLISTLLEESEFEIGTFEEGRQKGSVISYISPNKDKQIELRVKRSSSYELILYLFGEDDLVIPFRYKLEKEELHQIPKALRDLLEKVKDLGEPVSFYTSQIA